MAEGPGANGSFGSQRASGDDINKYLRALQRRRMIVKLEYIVIESFSNLSTGVQREVGGQWTHCTLQSLDLAKNWYRQTICSFFCRCDVDKPAHPF